MALDELHARRLLTLISVIEDALDRIQFLLEALEHGKRSGSASQPEAGALKNLRGSAGRIRGPCCGAPPPLQCARRAVRTGASNSKRNSPRSGSSWKLETTPDEGLRAEFAAEDRADWETLVHALLDEIEAMRQQITCDEAPAADPSQPGRFGN